MSWRLSYMSISCTLFVAKYVYSMFFRLWGSWMILFGLEASLVLWFGSWQNGGVDFWSAKLSLDSMLLIWGLAGFNQFFPNCRLLAFSRAECLLLGLFRGRMSSWCSFRCPCLDELETKSDVNILSFFCGKCVYSMLFSDCEAHGWLILVWRLLWCCDWPCVQHLHLLNFSEGSLVHVWCWLMMRKTFAGFNVADFRSRWIQFFFPKCRLLASSRAKCLPGVHSGVRA